METSKINPLLLARESIHFGAFSKKLEAAIANPEEYHRNKQAQRDLANKISESLNLQTELVSQPQNKYNLVANLTEERKRLQCHLATIDHMIQEHASGTI